MDPAYSTSIDAHRHRDSRPVSGDEDVPLLSSHSSQSCFLLVVPERETKNKVVSDAGNTSSELHDKSESKARRYSVGGLLSVVDLAIWRFRALACDPRALQFASRLSEFAIRRRCVFRLWFVASAVSSANLVVLGLFTSW